MKVCFIGTGNAGSWIVRGKQVAKACGDWTARQLTDLTAADIANHDLFCFVKHFHQKLAKKLRQRGKKVVYDVIDCWRQPQDGQKYRSVDSIISLFRKRLGNLEIDGIIFANKTMLGDLGQFMPNPVAIYHHHKPWLEPIVVKAQAQTVGYEGDVAYLGEWQPALIMACAELGLKFVVNPQTFADIDIGFAGRGGVHGSLLASRYKSNIKLANFYAAGLPCVVSAAEMSYRETDNGQVVFAASPQDMTACLRRLLPQPVRLAIHYAFINFSRNFSLDTIAAEYRRYFNSL